MNSLELDSNSRNSIVREINKSFFVEAGAGSGKTTMLVSRMVAMVESGIEVDNICAITFTKAAANEFYERFQKLLIERSNPNYKWEDKGYAGQLCEPTDITRERCAKALKNIDLCFMGTIDSFCNMILSEYPIVAGIPSDSTLITDIEASLMYSQYFVKVCEGLYGDEIASIARTFSLLHRDGKTVFSECMPFFMDNRNVHFNFPKETDFDIDHIFEQPRKDLLKLLKFLCEHKEIKYEGNKESVAVWDDIDKLYGLLRRRWSTNYSSILYAIKKLPKICINNGSTEAYPFELGSWFDQKRGFLKFTDDFTLTSNQLNKLKYSISMSLFTRCVSIFEDELRKKGHLTFFDYLYYLREMLREDAKTGGKLISNIYKRHKYYLIDEFQDTNPMQAEVFFYLTSEKPVERWEQCSPRPGSLFIVGDPKQSIYRFRGADVRSYLFVKELFTDHVGEVLSLTRNFRSTKVLCEYFNKEFSKLLPNVTADQSKFDEIPLPDDTVGEFQGVYIYKIAEGKAAEDFIEEHDHLQIPKIIRRLVYRDDYLIRAKGDKELRQIRYSDFMVITYGKVKLGPIMEELRVNDIPVKVEGKIPFEINEGLIESFKLYSAIANTDDTLALYGALTGKVIGLYSKDLLDYKARGGSLSLKSTFDRTGCNDEIVLKVADAIDNLKEWSKKAPKMSPAALFVSVVEGFKIFEYVKPDNIEVLYYTIELIRNAEKAGIIVNHKDCIQYISELLSGKSDQERCLALSDKVDSVRMANLHKVKGLEAPIVILAGAADRQRHVTKRIEHSTEGTEGYIFKMLPDDAGFKTPAYFETNMFDADYKGAEEASRNAETQRLIYVGATRARNALIICNRYQLSSNGNLVLNSKWSPIVEEGTPDIFEAVSSRKDQLFTPCSSKDSVELYKQGEQDSVIGKKSEDSLRANEFSTYEAVYPSLLRVLSKIPGEQTDENRDDEKPDSFAHRYPRLLGTTVHKLMEILVTSKGTISVEDAVGQVVREYKTPTNEQFIEQLSAALKTVAITMTSGGYAQTNGAPQDLLNTLFKADEVYCEAPFSCKVCIDDKDTIINGVMDLVYCLDDKWHIIDYKTNVDGDNLDMKYQKQLSAYTMAFQEITGNDADALIYHINI